MGESLARADRSLLLAKPSSRVGDLIIPSDHEPVSLCHR